MSIVRIATNFNIDIEFNSPPFYRRLSAWIIDLIIQVIYLIAAGRILGSIADSTSNNLDGQYNLQFIYLIMLVPFIVYHLVSEILMGGQSIGKKIMGIKVVSDTGSRASIGQFIIRWLIRTSDIFILIMIVLIPWATQLGPCVYWGFAGCILFIVLDVVLVNIRKQQRLGDLVAHTLLINTRGKESINDTIFLDISEKYVPSFPQVMQLSDRDINSLKSILDTARKRHDYNLAEMASDKIKSHLKIETSLSAFDFLDILLKDYNYLSAH